MSLSLNEITRNVVTAQVKKNIEAELSAVRALRDDAYVTTEAPKSYFIYAPAMGYRCPAIFTIVDRVSFKQFQDGANFITASVFMNLVALVEDRDLNHLTVKADRYMAALYACLNEVRLIDPDSLVMLWIKVTDAVFSEIYEPKRNTPDGFFRKEVHLSLDVMHLEGL